MFFEPQFSDERKPSVAWMPVIERWFLDAKYFTTHSESDVIELTKNAESNGSVAVSIYSLLGFDDKTFRKSIGTTKAAASDFGIFPQANSDRPTVVPFPGWARWTNRSTVVKLGMIWTFPVNVSSTAVSLHLSVEPGILWRFVDLYNYEDFAGDVWNQDFYLMQSVIKSNTLKMLNNVSFSRVENALSNMPPVKIVVETPIVGSPDTSETSNVKLAWLNMSDNTWVVLCNTSVQVTTACSPLNQLQATAYVNTSLFFDYARNHPDPYLMTHKNQYKIQDTWLVPLDHSKLSYYPLGFASNYTTGTGQNAGKHVYTQGQLDCMACDSHLQGGRPCDGCGGRFEVFSYAGCYVADGNGDLHPETWTEVSSSTSPYAGRKVVGCDSRVIPFGVPSSNTGGCSPPGFKGKVVLQPGGGFRAFIDADTFSVTVGAGLCVTPTPDPNVNPAAIIPDLNQPQDVGYPQLCSNLMRFFYDAAPSKDILVSVPIQYQPLGNNVAVAWYSVANNQWNPICSILPISENSLWLSIPVSVLKNADFSNGARGCADVPDPFQQALCDGFGARIACLNTAACNGFTPDCSSNGQCLSPFSGTVRAFNGTVSISGGFSGTSVVWIDSYLEMSRDTWVPQITSFWDAAFLAASGLAPKGTINTYGSPAQVVRVLFSSEPSNPLVITVNIRSLLSTHDTRVVKLAWYNRSADALFWTPICNSTATNDGAVSANLDLGLLTSPFFGKWNSDFACSPGEASDGTAGKVPPNGKACQKAAYLVVVITPWSFCHQGAEPNNTSPAPMTTSSQQDSFNCTKGTYRISGPPPTSGAGMGQGLGCSAGYTGTPCIPCDAGTFKDFAGSSSCTPCGPDTYSPTIAATCNMTCLQCPAFSTTNAASGLSQCLCNAGYQAERGSLSSHLLAMTNPTQYLIDWMGQQPTWMNYSICTPCRPGQYKSASGSGTCLPCEAGKYQSSPNATTCTACQDHSTSPPGSTNASLCVCSPGYTLNGSSCVSCLPGTYKEVIGSSKCLVCDFGKYSNLSAQTTAAQCNVCSQVSPYNCGRERALGLLHVFR